MAENKIFNLGKLLELGPGEEKDIDLFRVERAKTLLIKKVTVAFPINQTFKLEVYIMHGIHQIVPAQGILAGDGHQYSIAGHFEIPADSQVKAHAKNKDTVNPQACLIVVEGCYI